MQTFITDYSFVETMRTLDSQRLNKQLLESLQIAQYLTQTKLLNSFNPNAPHKNHPIVAMWKPYLTTFFEYMLANSQELINRNLAVDSHMHSAVEQFGEIVGKDTHKTPLWLNDKFISSHREALLYKTLMKLNIYEYSYLRGIQICNVAKNKNFQQKHKSSFVTFDHAPVLESSIVATKKLCGGAEVIYKNYTNVFMPIFPLNIAYTWG